jgi:predicted esterase
MTVNDNLSLPRILCLHGGGVSGRVFRLQCRTIIAQLATTFRLVFMDGPYLSKPHKDIVAVYGTLGPFFRWLPWHNDQPDLPPSAAADDIMNACLEAMDRDPGSGPWVGVLGFSQGAKVAASLLWAQQRAEELCGLGGENAHLLPQTQFKFGVLMAGSAPIIHLDARLPQPRHIAAPALFTSAFQDYPETPNGLHALHIPTLHVHGLQDEGLDGHRRLLKTYCKRGSTRLVEWDAGHRLPIKSRDVQVVVSQILDMAEECEVL